MIDTIQSRHRRLIENELQFENTVAACVARLRGLESQTMNVIVIYKEKLSTITDELEKGLKGARLERSKISGEKEASRQAIT